jgi:uracil-DNA glycosylase
MIHKIVCAMDTFGSWRNLARESLRQGLKPSVIVWSLEGALSIDLFASQGESKMSASVDFCKVPRRFLELARNCVCHSDGERFSILYELLFECVKNPLILENALHPLVYKILAMSKSVSRDMHKMKAFVRFKEDLQHNSGRRKFTAWFEPEHYIVEATSAFFVRRFNDMDWGITTPKGSAFFVDSKLTFDPSPATHLTADDDTESLWKTYYANIFNPARLKLNAMSSEMPKKYWHNLPEAMLIKELVANAGRRVDEMRSAQPTMPSPFAVAARAPTISTHRYSTEHFSSVTELNEAARKCQRCVLHCNATQTVVGEGPANAKLMIVGEQPGDEEDRSGRPFVGPAGKLFEKALNAAGIPRDSIYISNAVKHFKFEPRGKRRIHMRPNAGEIQHCKYWLINEIKLVRPKLILAMGATAAGVLTTSDKNIGARRGRVEYSNDMQAVMTTYHPSAILRAVNADTAEQMKAHLFSDIANAAAFSLAP